MSSSFKSPNLHVSARVCSEVINCSTVSFWPCSRRLKLARSNITLFIITRWSVKAFVMEVYCGAHVNKANLRDLIAATGLLILLKLDSNRRFFSLCGLEIWWMTSKNVRAPLLHYIKISKWGRWIQNGVTVWKHSIRVKISDFFVPCYLEIWSMTLKKQ